MAGRGFVHDSCSVLKGILIKRLWSSLPFLVPLISLIRSFSIKFFHYCLWPSFSIEAYGFWLNWPKRPGMTWQQCWEDTVCMCVGGGGGSGRGGSGRLYNTFGPMSDRTYSTHESRLETCLF